MKGYCLATIDNGGYIRTTGPTKRVVHRESLITDLGCMTFMGFDAAKAARYGDKVVLAIDDTDHACEIWVHPDNEEYVRDRLKIWAGCYGGWTVKKLNYNKEATLSPH